MASDFGRDGRVRSLVANDAEAKRSGTNKGDGTFARRLALAWGVAAQRRGPIRGQHGHRLGRHRGDARPDLLVNATLRTSKTTFWRTGRSPTVEASSRNQTLRRRTCARTADDDRVGQCSPT